MSVSSKSVKISFGQFPHLENKDTTELFWTHCLLGLLILAIAVRGYYIFVANVNWDEFYYLSFVHLYLNGELTRHLQTFHVHFFQWLPAISDNEVNQIIAARAAMLCLHLITAYFLFAISRRFFSLPGALFATLCYLCFSFTIQHGTSFRFDPIITCLLISVLYILLDPKKSVSRSLLAGLLISAATMVSIKSVIFMPMFGAVMLIRICSTDHVQNEFKHSLITILSAAFGLALFYYLHRGMIGADHGAILAIASHDGLIQQGFRKTILLNEFFPRFKYFQKSLFVDFAIWAAIFSGLFFVVRNIISNPSGDQSRSWMLAAMSLPLLTLIFYRNAYPYYYVFMMAPAVLLAGAAFDQLASRKTELTEACIRIPQIFFAVALISFGIVMPSIFNLYSQRQMLSVIHQAFPEKVSYIDRSSMVSSFPKTGFFMSSWGMENYLGKAKPVIKTAIEQDQPKFLLVNSPLLNLAAITTSSEPATPSGLLKEDIAAIRNNFIPHWGQLFVAGKFLVLKKSDLPEMFEINIGGTYTVESSEAITINNHLYSPGDLVELKTGRHKIQSRNNTQNVSLRWGKHLHRLYDSPPNQPLFSGF